DSLEPAPCPECNLVLVTFDALRADRIGAYGYPKATTPALDRFAEGAFLFTDAMSQSGTTMSSLPSLFTGKFPQTDSLIETGEQLRVRPGETLLAERLRAGGRHTAAVVAHEFARGKYGFAAGFDRFDDEYGESELAAATSLRVAKMLDGLESPFFLWVHFRQPHSPYESTDADFAEFYDGPATTHTVQKNTHAEVLAELRSGEPVDTWTFGAALVEMTPTMLAQYAARYDGNLKRGDAAFGALLHKLEQRDDAGQTIVVVAADHGESLGEYRIFDHNTLIWGAVHTPLLVRIPGSPGGRLEHPVSNVDILPTLLRLLDLPAAKGIRGRDLFDSERKSVPQIAEYSDRRTIKLGDWKLMERPPRSAGPRLHNVARDPLETTDLYEKEGARAQQLEALLAALDGTAPEASDPLRDKLRALGYLH
ncbi:MAG: sulfatase, partial [bacterium]